MYPLSKERVAENKRILADRRVFGAPAEMYYTLAHTCRPTDENKVVDERTTLLSGAGACGRRVGQTSLGTEHTSESRT